ncbi:MAG: hypothetical protein Fues2KO_13600 [Fuerstiella sp.]
MSAVRDGNPESGWMNAKRIIREYSSYSDRLQMKKLPEDFFGSRRRGILLTVRNKAWPVHDRLT